MSNNVIPQVSGNNNIVKLVDAQGNPEYFIRTFKQGHEVLIPLSDFTDKIDGSIDEIKKLIPTDTSEQNPLVNNLKLYKELHRVPNSGTLLAGAKVGDILWVDPANGDKYFFDKSIYPISKAVEDGLESVGIVADVSGRKLLILHKNESDIQQFADCWLFKVDGINLDGTTNTLNMQRYDNNGTAVPAGTFTDSTSTTLADFCASLDAWLREHQTVSGATEAGWHCELMPDVDGVDSCFIVFDVGNTVNRLTPIGSESTATATLYMAQFSGQTTDRTVLLRNNGSEVYYAGVNKERLIEYFSDPTHASISPTNDPNGTGLLNKADFEGSSYPNVKAAYNNDYGTYISAMLMKWPSTTGNQVTFAGTGKDIGRALGTHTHKNISGETVYTFPACRYAYTRATSAIEGSEGLGIGEWHMPDVVDAFLVLSKMKVDRTDAINDSLYAITGKYIDLSNSRWCANRSGVNGAWVTFDLGYFGAGYFTNRAKTISVALLEY